MNIIVTIVAYILNLFAPIVFWCGLFGFFGCGVYDDCQYYLYSLILFILGIIFGVFAYKQDIPPRWSWTKSHNELFRFSVSQVIGYGISFAMWPFAIWMITVLVTGAKYLPEVP
jgi:hypothetical protein